MLKTLINAWNIKDIRSKMLYTLLLIVIYRFGSFIPVPGVDAAKIAAAASQYDILSFLNLLSGGNFGQFTIFAMGISPYITGSIIIQLLTIAIPALERLAKEEDGRQKIERITRYTGIGLALVQSIGIVMGLQNQYGVVANPSFLTYLTLHPAAEEALSETFVRETNKTPAGLLEIEPKHPSWLPLEFP